MRVDEASVLIDSSPVNIFRAMSDRNSLEKWLPPDGMKAEMLEFDFREDGRYRMRLSYLTPEHSPGKTTEDYDDVEVRISRVVPDKLIEQLVSFDSPDPDFAGTMRMSWIVDVKEQGTSVTVRCEDVPVGISPEDHEVGLSSSLANLARFLEGNH